ncbi:MAG TPA: M36 family metallopeptidase [Aridibacter sp.]|nr:M36 family metallopeptidase [Aridibacter sp.]
MNTAEAADARKRLTLSLAVLALLGTAIFLPLHFQSEASTQDRQESAKSNIFHRTESHEPGLENYDIRTDKSEEVTEALVRFRTDAGTSAYAIADKRENFVRGENELRTRVTTLKVDYNEDLMVPEVISPDVWNARIENLMAPSNAKRSEILRNFVKQNNGLIGIDDRQADSLKVLADYENPAGNMSFAHLEQRIDGIPVFRGEIKAGFRKDGSMIRVINNLAPGLDYENLSRNFCNPMDAVRAAAGNINVEVKSLDLEPDQALTDENKKVFGRGPSATTAERMYFPTEIGVARPAWRVLIWQPVNAYYVIVDAETGTMLWRKNITEDQTQSATYEVYRNSSAFIDVADSPAPLTPGPVDPTLGTQGALLTRENVVLIGNEGPLSFNDNGWITDGANGTDGWTDGNATEAGLDIDGTDGVDAPMNGTGRVFSSAWNPPPGNPPPGDAPTTADARFGAVVQMFYVMNRYHDVMYQLGFTEQTFNFQHDNFGRGGLGNDRIRSEGQDSSGTNNANFSTPADGGRGRMQMFRFTGMDPDRDGTTDADVIIHEATHGTSNRLHGNASGLGNNMSRGMGEGWSDFYAHALLAEPSDPINGIYTTGGYVTLEIAPGFTGNFYYGIRRFPKAVIAFTGGPGNLPHNPLTFADLNAGCVLTDGAFPRGPVGSATCDQVHNAGEVWSSALWEIRALMITRLGFAAGTERVLQVVTDGMKLAPLNPTFIQERDAIIAAATALPASPEASADIVDVREGFRRRGMGFSAEVIAASPANVVEAFDFPNVRFTEPFSVSDSTGDNDGFPEPGENVLLSIAVENTTGATITNVSVSVNGQASVSYGNLNDGQTVTQDIPYAIPSSLGSVVCGEFHNVEIVVSSDEGVQSPVNQQFRLGAPVGGPAQTFESADGPIDLPAGQPGSTSGPGDPYPSTISVAGLSGNKVVSVELTDLNHTWVGDLDFLLESPAGETFIMMSDAYSSSNRTNTVITTLFLRDDAADTMPSSGVPPTSGTFRPTNHGANDPFDAPAPAGPHENPAPAGSATFQSTFGMDGSAMNGDWKLWIDDDAGGDPGVMAGWKITFESDDYVCNLAAGVARADFDGDGRTDVSVFRPSEGNWYINGSTSGFFGLNWGLAGDVLVPADYDGDGTTDVAVARMTDDESQADFYIINSDTLTFTGYSWGQTGDIPLAGDYNGDGKDDVTVYRPSDNTWYTALDNGTALIRQFGGAGDTPIVGDFDGDGTDDLATWNAGVINVQLSGGGNLSRNVGGDINVTGDFDGDGKHDPASYDTSTGEWRIWMSLSDTLETFQFGVGTDIPAPGDYDGDGKQDLAIYRNGDWWIYNSFSETVTVFNFGVGGDSVLPLASAP